MAQDTYTDLSQDGIAESLREYLRGQDEFKDFDFDGSAMSVLIGLLAYNAQMLSFQTNMQFNESFLDSAEIRSNVSSRASALGYSPKSRTAAQAKISFVVTPVDAGSAPAQLTLKRNSLSFIAVKDNVTYAFSPDDDYTATLTNSVYTFKDVTVLQGEWAATAFEVEGSAVQSYQIPSQNVDTSTLVVEVRDSINSGTGDQFLPYNHLFTTEPTDKLYHIRENRKGFYEIEFGDGLLHHKVEDGNVIVVEYLETKGKDGNGISTYTPVGAVGGYSDIKVTSAEKSYNGREKETIEEIKFNAPVKYASKNSAVINSHYAPIVRELFTDTDDVISWGGELNNPPKYGYDFIAIKPASAEAMTQSQKDTLIAQLTDRNVGSVTPVIIDPDYLYIHLNAVVKHDPRKTSQNEIGLGNLITESIAEFSNTKLEKFGASYHESQMSQHINLADPSVISNQITIELERRFAPSLEQPSNYTINMLYPINDGTLYISGFTMPGTLSNFTDYIVNNGNTLELRKKSADTDSYVRDIGVIDNCGRVHLSNFLPESFDGYVSVLGETDSEDIETSNQTILELTDIQVEVIS